MANFLEALLLISYVRQQPREEGPYFCINQNMYKNIDDFYYNFNEFLNPLFYNLNEFLNPLFLLHVFKRYT